jgi:hypothetical protein
MFIRPTNRYLPDTHARLVTKEGMVEPGPTSIQRYSSLEESIKRRSHVLVQPEVPPTWLSESRPPRFSAEFVSEYSNRTA